MFLNCKDFEQTWNERLDDRPTGADARLSALEAHAATCSECRAIHARYLVLAQAIHDLAPTPGPSAAFTEGVLSAWATEAQSARRSLVYRVPVRLAALVAAAVLVVGVALGVRVLRPRSQVEPLIAQPANRAPGGFALALADVTSATIALARETSEPAARVGRDVLASADLPTASTADAASALTLALALPVDVPTSETWQRVGDRLNAGVRPLEGSARRAFSFLRVGSGDPKPVPRPAPGA
jgi:predicted anti-sigma-YlaC factor YlaD